MLELKVPFVALLGATEVEKRHSNSESEISTVP